MDFVSVQSMLVNYLLYLGCGFLLLAVFSVVYMKITPVDEIALIRQGVIAPALSFGGALLGFSLTLASSAMHTNAIAYFVIWGVLAGVIQVLAFVFMSLIIKGASAAIAQNNIAIGALLGITSLAIGILNAGCLS